MLRWLIIGCIAFMLYRLWQKAGRLVPPTKGDARPAFKKPSEMVGCQGCGTYVLKTAAIESNGLFYCSEDCRRKK